MNPVALQVPGSESDEFVIARDQPEYIPLPAMRVNTPDGPGVLTRWRPTAEERAGLAAGADIWIVHLTHGGPLQPLQVHAICPISTEPT